jgi:hypothetical protein
MDAVTIAVAHTGFKQISVKDILQMINALSRDLCQATVSARTLSPKTAGTKWDLYQYRPRGWCIMSAPVFRGIIWW